MNNYTKFNTIKYGKIIDSYYHEDDMEYLKIEFNPISFYCVDYSFIQEFNKIKKIYFVYDIKDNLKFKDINITSFDMDDIYNSEKQIVEINESKNNVLSEMIASTTLMRNYILNIFMNKNTELTKKIYSHNYKLFIFSIDSSIIIKLIFSPNIRKYKLQQLDERTR